MIGTVIGVRSDAVRVHRDQARESLENIADPAELNELVALLVGPMEVQKDGAVRPKESPEPALADPGQTQVVAGGGFEPPTSGL